MKNKPLFSSSSTALTARFTTYLLHERLLYHLQVSTHTFLVTCSMLIVELTCEVFLSVNFIYACENYTKRAPTLWLNSQVLLILDHQKSISTSDPRPLKVHSSGPSTRLPSNYLFSLPLEVTC